MKLLIKKKYWDEIEKGIKNFEFREAHITFIDDVTGEVLGRKEVKKASVKHTAEAFTLSTMSLKEWEKMFKENWIIVFELR